MPSIIPPKNGELVLGLDLGIASVGWSLLSFQGDNPIFLDAGVKIFQEPVEAKSGTPKNHKRRDARGARKNLARKVARKQALRKTLKEHGLIVPENHTKNPYELRTQALDRKLAEEEIAIMLYHLSQKRGFLSNSKSGNSDEDGKVHASITTIEKQMSEIGARTLGEYRWKCIEEQKKNNESPKKFEEKYTSRAMYRDEFDKIWNKQKEFYPEILTDELYSEIKNHIFHQRPLKVQKNLVGNCMYFPHRKRAARASLITQEFLIWKNINDLKYKLRGTYNFLEIPLEKKKILADELMKQGSMAYTKAKKILSLGEDIVFNFENGKRESFDGNVSGSKIGKIWEKWDTLSRDDQDHIITDLLTIQVDTHLEKRLVEHWGMTSEQAKKIMEAFFSESRLKGYIGYSEKALKKILPIMQKTGENDRKIIEDLIREGVFPKQMNIYDALDPWITLPPLRNPIVQKAIVEARKVIKAIKNTYGEPTMIRIEMASEMKKTQKQKKEDQRKNLVNKKENDEAKKFLEESGENNSYNKRLLYKLHKECGGICPYTGKRISPSALYSGTSEFDIEHIIPYSRSLDDSYMNKTLCYAGFNRDIKKNKTPWEIGQTDPEWYREAKLRFDKLPPQKRRRFDQQEVNTDEFISRQLNDTRYICQEVRAFCESLIGKANVEITKGSLTSLLVHSWGFDELISKTEEGKKDRSDHRHHAIDATIVALTSRSLLQDASRVGARNEELWKKGDDSHEKLSTTYKEIGPGKIFFEDFKKKFDAMVISHTATHKIRGGLHEETGFGKITDPNTGEETFVVRKKIPDTMKDKDFEKVIDPTVREILRAYFSDGRKFSPQNPPLHKDGKTPIRSVRMKETKSDMYDFRDEGKTFFTYGSNHHVEILEHKTQKNKDGTPKREGIFVTMFEANRRAKQKESIVNRSGPWENTLKGKQFNISEWEFSFSLSNNDMVKYFPNPEKKDEFEIFRVQKMTGATSQITFQKHNTSGGDDLGIIRVSPNTLNIQKLQIDPLGNISPAND